LGRGVGGGEGLVIEAITTFLLVWVIFATAADPRGAFKSIAGLAIGLTITLDIFFGGPLTGAAMNPARAFGPELVQNFWASAWVWYVGPALGVRSSRSRSGRRLVPHAAQVERLVGERARRPRESDDVVRARASAERRARERRPTARPEPIERSADLRCEQRLPSGPVAIEEDPAEDGWSASC